MSDLSELAAAMVKVQANLPKLERDRTVEVRPKNSAPYGYSYATLANLSEAVLPLLAENGLTFITMPGSGSQGGMCLRYTLMHTSGQALSGEFPISAEGGIQQLGGRITYARRYILAAVVGITADEDDESRLSEEGPRTAQRAPKNASGGAQTARRSTPPPPLPQEDNGPGPATGPQLTKAHTVFTSIGWTERDDKLRASSVIVGRPLTSSTDMTKAEAHTLIEALEMVSQQPDPQTALEDLLGSIQEREPA